MPVCQALPAVRDFDAMQAGWHCRSSTRVQGLLDTMTKVLTKALNQLRPCIYHVATTR